MVVPQQQDGEYSVDAVEKTSDASEAVEQASAQRILNTDDNSSDNAIMAEEDVPPAGLSSDRCFRDFATRCNQFLHSGMKQKHLRGMCATYKESTPKHAAREQQSRTGNAEGQRDLPKTDAVLDKKYSLRMKLSEQYALYNHVEMEQHNVTEVPETVVSAGRDMIRIRDKQHFCIFNDFETEQQQPLDPKSFTLESSSQHSFESCFLDQSPSYTDSGRSTDATVTETTIIGGTRTLNSKDPDWEIASFRMAGIRPKHTEKHFETLARQCDVQIVSLNLDRNILTHVCNGTGNIKLRHTGGEEQLLRLSGLLAKNGIRLDLIDIISRSELMKNAKIPKGESLSVNDKL